MSQIYLGDYRDILPSVPHDTTIVSDPPYGIGFQYDKSYSDAGGDEYMALLRPLAGRKCALLSYPEEMMRYLVPVFGPPDDCFIWCYNANTRRQSRIWGFWGCRPDFRRVKQPAKNPTYKRVAPLVASFDWCSDIQQVKNVSAEKTSHPCQIPVALAERVIRLLGCPDVFDPFMGSGSIGEAAMRCGASFDGCEVSPEYFAIADARLGLPSAISPYS
jgi:DNA modification methylase